MANGPEWTIQEYRTADGTCPVMDFLTTLAGKHRDDAIALLGRLRHFGNQLRPPTSRLLETNLLELRGHQVRVFYMFLPGRRVVLLDGMIKKQDKIPGEVMQRVRRYQQQVGARESARSE
jgi:phage-related protein